ncbi:hypothetical protein HGB07_00930 [Candidatus Roizmanbacteria bacterium]|nr:hypothetical protein [Candidatus Roizmanbacteria bacterium]
MSTKTKMETEAMAMATRSNSSDVISLRDALNMEIIINQALIDLLVAKGILTQQELMTKIEEIRKEMPI